MRETAQRPGEHGVGRECDHGGGEIAAGRIAVALGVHPMAAALHGADLAQLGERDVELVTPPGRHEHAVDRVGFDGAAALGQAGEEPGEEAVEHRVVDEEVLGHDARLRRGVPGVRGAAGGRFEVGVAPHEQVIAAFEFEDQLLAVLMRERRDRLPGL